MAAKRDQEPKKTGRSGNARSLLDALQDLRRTILAEAKQAPPALRRAMASVFEELEELNAGASTTDEQSIGAALQAGLTLKRKQTGRHDKQRVPPGYVFSGTSLHKDTKRVPATERDLAIVRGLRDLTEKWLSWVPAPEFDTNIIGPRRASLEGAYEALAGYPFGEDWRAALEFELDRDAWAVSTAILREAHQVDARTSAVAEPVSDDQFLVRLRMHMAEGAALPPELTAPKVSELRRQTALNKGGKKKTPRQVVQEFAKKLRR